MTAFKKQEVHKFFKSKLGCEAVEGGRHTIFRLRLKDSRVALPHLTVERGSGDLTLRNLKGLADDLGLSLRGIEEGIRCPLRRHCIVLCNLARFVGLVLDYHIDDKVVYKENELGDVLKDVCDSVTVTLRDLETDSDKPTKWRKVEQSELHRAMKNINRAGIHSALGPALATWRRWAELDAENTE
jgi:hypothetical protein